MRHIAYLLLGLLVIGLIGGAFGGTIWLIIEYQQIFLNIMVLIALILLGVLFLAYSIGRAIIDPESDIYEDVRKAQRRALDDDL